MPDMTAGEAIEFVFTTEGWSRERTAALIASLLPFPFWSPEAIVLGIRANFRCEYCQREFLASPDDFKLWERDHISRRHPSDNSLENLALACLPCNSKFKCRWSPPDGTRAERIDSVIDYVTSLRKVKSEELMRVSEIVGSAVRNV